MSRAQGFFPLFLATVFGVANGVWVFGPALKEQQENEAYPKDQLVASDEVDKARVEELRIIEAAISHASATQAAVKSAEKPSPRWTSMSGWGAWTSSTKTIEGKSSSEEATSLAQKSFTLNKDLSERPATESQDSVIGPLVEQVAKDPDLKMLLETVASGKATTDQLKTFQIHIDQLKRR